MQTKFDVGDNVLIPAKIESITIDCEGPLYRIDIPQCDKYFILRESLDRIERDNNEKRTE